MCEYFACRLDSVFKRHINIHYRYVGLVFAVLFYGLHSVGGFRHYQIILLFNDASKHQSHIGDIIYNKDSFFQIEAPLQSMPDKPRGNRSFSVTDLYPGLLTYCPKHAQLPVNRHL